jgi:hypothetical protein
MRFDGKVSNKQRGVLLKSFRDEPAVRVALMTISCGAVGYTILRLILVKSDTDDRVSGST